LNTYGAGSLFADNCTNFYFAKNSYVTQLKLYNKPGYGIAGTVFIVSNGDYNIIGDVTG
jgi:hypothetical protein